MELNTGMIQNIKEIIRECDDINKIYNHQKKNINFMEECNEKLKVSNSLIKKKLETIINKGIGESNSNTKTEITIEENGNTTENNFENIMETGNIVENGSIVETGNNILELENKLENIVETGSNIEIDKNDGKKKCDKCYKYFKDLEKHMNKVHNTIVKI